MSAFRLLVALILFLTCWSTTAQPTTTRDKSIDSSSLQAPAPQNLQSAELGILKAQLEDSRRFQDQILNTVWWALGCLVSTALLLVGFGWFTTQKGNDRDKRELAHDLRTELKALELALRTDLEKTLLSRVDGQAKRLVGDVQRDVLELQMDQQHLKRERYIGGKSWRNALQASKTILDLALKKDFEYTIYDALDTLAVDIGNVVSEQAQNPRASVDTYLVNEVIAALDRIQGTKGQLAQELKRRVLSLRTG